MNKKIIALAAALLCFTVAGLFAQESETPATTQTVAEDQASTVEAKADSNSSAIKYVAAAFAVALACIAGGMAVGKIGASRASFLLRATAPSTPTSLKARTSSR